MKLIPALVLAVGLAACSSGAAHPTSPGPTAVSSLTACESAMELAADPLANVLDLDEAIKVCDSYADWAAASARYRGALDGGNPLHAAQDRCAEGEGLASEPLCQEVGEAPCVPGLVCDAALVPGEYSSTSTGANITFTLTGEGWSGLEEDTPGEVPGDGFALSNEAVGGRHGIGVHAYAGEVYTQVCSGEATGTAVTDLVTFLAAVEGVHAEEPVATQVGGRPAIRLDLTTDSPCFNPDLRDDPDRMWLWPLPVHGDFHFNDGEQVRVYAVDAACVTVAIVIEAFPEANFDVLLEKAEEVIATMTIAPAC